MGTDSLAAIAVFESRYTKAMMLTVTSMKTLQVMLSHTSLEPPTVQALKEHTATVTADSEQ